MDFKSIKVKFKCIKVIKSIDDKVVKINCIDPTSFQCLWIMHLQKEAPTLKGTLGSIKEIAFLQCFLLVPAYHSLRLLVVQGGENMKRLLVLDLLKILQIRVREFIVQLNQIHLIDVQIRWADNVLLPHPSPFITSKQS